MGLMALWPIQDEPPSYEQSPEQKDKMGGKHSGKRRKCWLPAFSPFPRMVSKALRFRVIKTRDCAGKNKNVEMMVSDLIKIVVCKCFQYVLWKEFKFYHTVPSFKDPYRDGFKKSVRKAEKNSHFPRMFSTLPDEFHFFH